MSKRKTLAIVAAVAAFAAVSASAASLGGLTGTSLGADTTVVAVLRHRRWRRRRLHHCLQRRAPKASTLSPP